MTPNHFRYLAALSATAFVVVLMIWPAWWVPSRLGLVIAGLLAVPGLLALPGLWRGKVYTHAWTTMLATLYGAYAAWEAYGWPAHRPPALTALSLAVLWFVASNLFVRGQRLQRISQ